MYQFSRSSFWSNGVTWDPFPMSKRKLGVAREGQIFPNSCVGITWGFDLCGAVCARFLFASICILLKAPSLPNCHRYWLVRRVLLNSSALKASLDKKPVFRVAHG